METSNGHPPTNWIRGIPVSRPGEVLAIPDKPFDEKLLPSDIFSGVKESLKRQWYKHNLEEHIADYELNWHPRESFRPGSRMIALWKKITYNSSFTLNQFFEACAPSLDSGDMDDWILVEESDVVDEVVSPAETRREDWILDRPQLVPSEPFLCNKATAFYWMQSATVPGPDCNGLAIIGSIWDYWKSAIDRQPHFILKNFFAEPIFVYEKWVRTIPEVVDAHKAICASTQQFLDKKEKWVEYWPDPRYFRLHPVFRALITVFDEYKNVKEAFQKQPDGFRHFKNVGQHQTILLVQTGTSDGLSSPISFDSIMHEALPLARYEELENINVIRVPLKVGVQFVANLMNRENTAFPELDVGGPIKSKEPDNPIAKCERYADAWIESALARTQEQGSISSSMTVAEVRRAVLGSSIWCDAEDPEYDFPCHGKLMWK